MAHRNSATGRQNSGDLLTDAIYFNGDLRDVFNAFRNKPKWLIEPYLPVEGIVLLHGKFSTGKSPILWKLAQCVSEGLDFFGYKPERTGKVLYVEIDEPLIVTKDRLSKLDPMPKNVQVLGMKPFNITSLSIYDEEQLRNANEDGGPAVVLVNSLRKCHTMDDKDSATPSMVYGAWQELFPKSCFVFVHHDKKSDVFEGRRTAATDEDFSGSQAWINDAQIGLHLRSVGDSRRSRQMALEMTKSQLSSLQDPLQLKLSEDGVNWVDTAALAVRETFRLLDPNLPKMTRYEMVAAKLNVGNSTVRRILHD